MSDFSTKAVAASQILDTVSRLQAIGALASNDANVTYRLGGGRFLTLATGFYRDRLTSEALVEVYETGKAVNTRHFARPSADIGVHLAIFRAAPWAGGVITAQPLYSTLRAIQGKALDEALLPSTVRHLGVVGVAPYGEPGSVELEVSVQAAAQGSTALLLANRGIAVWGSNLFEAFKRLETAEQLATLAYLLEGREKKLLAQSDIDALVGMREKYAERAGGVPVGQGD